MSSAKIINLKDKRLKGQKAPADAPVSEELQKAIQHLIYRLRELGPLSQ